MAVQLAYVKDMSKKEWLLQRKNGIGGSDASAILGLNPYKSILEVYMDKVSPVVTKADLEQSESQYWGSIMEDIIAREFTKRTGLKVRRNNFILQHPRHPFMLANLDRVIVGENCGLECKTANEYTKNQWEEDVPEYYITQVQHYMAVTGFDGFYVAVLIGGNNYKDYFIERDEKYIDSLIQKEKEFWLSVQTRTWPEPDGSKATEEYIKNLYPLGNSTTVGLDDNIDGMLFDRDELEKEIKTLETKKRKIENTIKKMMKEAEKAITDNWRINWTTIDSTKFDSVRLKEEKPDIYEQYSTTSSYRRFTVKQKVKKED